MTTPVLDRSLDTQTGQGSGPVAHIVPPLDGKDGASRAMESRLTGTPITALCGTVYVPHRNTREATPCPACVDVLEHRTGSRGDGVKEA